MEFDTLTKVAEHSNVTRERFESEIRPGGQPAVLRGVAADWPIVGHSEDRELADYVESFDPSRLVKAFFGEPSIKGRFFYNEEFDGFNFRQRELPLAELLGTLRRHEDDTSPPSIYAGAIQLTGRLEALMQENRLGLLPDGQEQLTSIWIGNRGRTATHWDLPQNIATVVHGERRFTLFPPEQLENLYIGPLDFTLAGQPISLVDLHDPDYDTYPKFRDAIAEAQTATLEPGDAIYIPSMWFHNVDNLSRLGVLVNTWWRDSEPYMFTPLFTMYHALLSIRDLPDDEKAHWRRMFDHYIFETNGKPMEHVPEHARGVFQDITPRRVVALRNFLVHNLGGELRRDE